MKALFVGLITLDLIYQVEQAPQANQKSVAQDFSLAAGGPATNAAVAFAARQKQSETETLDSVTPTLLTCLGQHPFATLAQNDLQGCGVSLLDLAPDWVAPPPMSSIWVHAATGDRTVVSLNATRIRAEPASLPTDLLQDVGIVLIDGHQMAIGSAIAHQAQQQNIPVIVDGGSWKPGFERVLCYADVVIASANFFPPGTQVQAEVFEYLRSLQIPYIAVTQGAKPIVYSDNGDSGTIDVLPINAVDTLGAGDVFHGAFCHFWLQGNDFKIALGQAAEIAAIACQSFGTRTWLRNMQGQ